IAYSELYFSSTLWPDFRVKEYLSVLLDYQNRGRRFGAL
ncbi:MAG: undecaprenyl diphosphate synthase family protein, partial [Candidatus Aminicenantes bacterium]|nr:undecaprenyl diphosphate synthase family protein [Candidatus Aminicenantes bacterium]